MSNLIQPKVQFATLGAMAFLSAGSATAAEWSTANNPIYVVQQQSETYTPLKFATIGQPKSDSFPEKMAQIYAALSEGQEPLGGEFEAVWDANIDALFEA